MSQITTGIRAVLSHPIIYDLLQNIMGAHAVRQDLITHFMHPGSGCRILDIGCGTAEILSRLPLDIEYWGYDISSDYINAAKRNFGGRGHFECGMLDHEELSKLPRFDIVLALGVLHHMDDLLATNLFSLAHEALGEGGRVISIDPCLTPTQNPVARYLITHDRGQNVRDADGYRDLAAAAFGTVNGTLRHRTWIPYTHWIMECSA